MSTISFEVWTEDKAIDLAMSAAVKAIEVYERSKGENATDNERRILKKLVAERFKDYNSRRSLEKIRDGLKKANLERFDRDGNLIISYNELKKFLFNK